MVRRRARRWENTLTIGVSKKWHGACISQPNAVPANKEQQKTKPTCKANSATYAAAATVIADPHFKALIVTIGVAIQRENKED
jgi:hypothetical protein